MKRSSYRARARLLLVVIDESLREAEERLESPAQGFAGGRGARVTGADAERHDRLIHTFEYDFSLPKADATAVQAPRCDEMSRRLVEVADAEPRVDHALR